jgi:quinolinate synthase
MNLYDDLHPTTHLPPIDEAEMSDEKVLLELKKVRQELGEDVCILGHHYQQDDIIALSDVTGDSLELAKVAQKLQRPHTILFCGVHFMAETADMLCGNKTVILPDMKAGCSMADMANIQDIEQAWAWMAGQTADKIIPITYINCAASLKAFVGKNEGAICTSSNAEKIIRWGLERGEKMLFFPDQHLGRNTCFKMGIPLSEMVVYNPKLPQGGLSSADIKKAKVILWYGYCSVHQGFQLDHVKEWRRKDPARMILVHPECNFEVTQAADLAGSTSYIIRTIEQAPAGSKFAVGTEINLVNRLAKRFQDKDITSLSPYQCLCTTMYRIRPRWLLESLLSVKRKQPINIVKVDAETTRWSLLALERMLENS